VAVKAKRKWNPSLHPRDARGRFTRSSTRVMQPADRKRAAAGQQGFAPAELGDAAARGEWLARESAATPPPSGRIAEYLNGGWRADNPAMRSGKPVDGLAELDAAFVPLGEDVMLRRVVPSAMFAHIPISDLVGMKVRDAAPASSSLDHTGPGHPGAVTMHIAAPAGTRAYVNDEAGEVLLMRDTEVAITRAVPRPDGNGWDLYGALIPRKDAPARQPRRAEDPEGTETPAVDGRTPAAGPDDAPEGDETTAGGVGTGAGGEDGGGGEVTPDAAPASDPLVLWKDAETGRPVYNPGQPEIVRGQVVRDPEREERVRRGMALAAAAMAGEPEPATAGGDRDQDDQGGEQRAAAAPADSTAGGEEDGAAGGAPADQPAEAEPVKPTRNNWRDHGKPATAVYYGRGKKADAEGRRVTITQNGMGYTIADAETGDSIDGLGITAKIWLAPDPDAENRDQDDQDAPAPAEARETPAAGTRAPSDRQDAADDAAAPVGDDQDAEQGEAEDNGPLIDGAPLDVIRAAVGSARYHSVRAAGGNFQDALSRDEKRAVWDALTGEPLDHDRMIAALGAPRYNGIYQDAVSPSTRDQDREAVMRAALARQLTAEEKAAVEATPATPIAGVRDLSGAPEGSMAASVADGIREGGRRALGGGNSGATVELVTLEDGRQAVRKRSAPGQSWLNPDRQLTPKDQQDAEELGALVAGAFGLRAPEVVRVDDETSFFEFIPGSSGMEQLVDADDKNGLLHSWATSDDGKRMGAADTAMGNPDRNAGNFVPDGDGLVLLDHSLAFDYGGADPAEPWLDRVGRDWFMEHYVQRLGGGGFQWRENNPLTAADVAEVGRRLDALQPKFAELGREEWLDATRTRLAELGKRAGGERNLIAGDDQAPAAAPETPAAGTSAPSSADGPADGQDPGEWAAGLSDADLVLTRGRARTLSRNERDAADAEYDRRRAADVAARGDAAQPAPREDPAGYAATLGNFELAELANRKGVLPRLKKAAVAELARRNGDDQADTAAPAEDVTPATTAAATGPEADLPRTQAKALGILRQLGDGEHSEYAWRTAGAGIAAIQQLERKGFVTRERKPFVMPAGPYAGETFQEWHYTLAGAETVPDVRRDEDALAAAPLALHDPDSPLTTEQRDALAAYQDGAGFASFQAVNGVLRGTAVGDRPDTQRVIDGIDGAMAASKLTDAVQVWRGVRRLDAVPAGRRDGDLTGATWREDGFLSTAPIAEHATPFAGSGRTPVVMRLTVPAGVGAVSMYDPNDPTEIELLVDRGHEIRVTADHGIVNGRRRLDAEVLPKTATAGTDAPGDAPAADDQQAPTAAAAAPATDPAGEVPAPADGTAPGVPADLTTATPVQIDTTLADLYYAEGDLQKRVDSALKGIRQALGQKATRRRGVDEWPTSAEDAIAEIRAKGDAYLARGQYANEVVAKYDAAVARLEANRAEQAPLHAEFSRRGGWTRFFAVSDGHIHRDQNCSTLHRGKERTPLSWMLDMSGTNENDAIRELAEQAHVLCSVCIPNAPVVKPADPPRRLTAEEQRARKADLDRRKALEDPKLITDVDGEPLRVDGDLLRTVRTAEIKGVDQLWWGAFGLYVGPDPNEPYARKHEEGALQIARALAAKRGTTPGAELDTMIDKAVKKLRKDYRDDKTIADRAAARWADWRAGLPGMDDRIARPGDDGDRDAGEGLDTTPAAADVPAGDAPESPAAGTSAPDDNPEAPPAAAAADVPPADVPAGPPLDADRDLARRAQDAAGLSRTVGLPRRSARMDDPTYKADYNRGWKASQSGSASIDRGDERNEWSAWYDGWSDYSIGVAKWTTPREDDANDRGLFAGEPLFRVQAYRVDPDTGDRTESGRPEAFYGRDRLAMYLRDFGQAEVRAEDFRDDESGAVTGNGGRAAYEWTATPQDQLDSRPRTEEDLIRAYQARNETPAGDDQATAAGTSAPADAPPAAGPLDGLPADDQARIRIAVADHAGKLFRNPMLTGDPDDVARYLAEGELTKVTDRHGLKTIWAAVAQALAADPDARTRSQAEIDANAEARRAEAARLSSAAAAATRAGEFDNALALIDQGEQADPDFTTDRGRGWTSLRELVTSRQEKAAQDAGDTTPAETPAPTGPAPIVAGSVNDAPLSPNNWGGIPSGPVHYHPDGEIGRAVSMLGADARLDVDGLPLAEYLNRLATQGARGEITAQDQVDRLRELAGRLPDGTAKRVVTMAAEDLDAPATPAPDVPEGTPEPLARLMAELWAVPMVRRDGAEAPEIAGLNKAIARANRGSTSGRRLADMIRGDVLNKRHESKEGKTEIDRAVRRAMDDLEAMPRPESPAAGTSAPDADQPATPAPAAAAAVVADDDPFAAMTTRVPKTVSRAETADGTAPGVYETDMFGNVTAFVPGRREAIGVAARADVGRERSIAAAQQLGLLDETEMRGGGLGGAEVALFGLFDMPPADPPAAATPPAPDTSEDDQRNALAGRVLGEDLDGWTDEQLAGAFADLTSGDDLTEDQGAAVRRIEALWQAREDRMRAVVAGIPEDLTTLDDDEAVALLVALTSTPGAMDQAAVDRVNADLDRREAEATEGARNAAELMERAYGDTAGFTTEDEWSARHEAAVALGDWDQVDNNLAAWTRWEEAEAARVAIAQQEADRIEAERIEALRIEQEAAAARQAAIDAEAERVRTERQMIAARAAAVIPPTEDSAVRSAHQTLGEDGTRRVIGADKYDAIAAAAANGPLQDPGAKVYAIRAALLGLPEDDKARLVMASAEVETPADIREMDEMALLMEVLMIDTPDGDETPEQREARLERARFLKAEQRRRGMLQLVAEGREQFATYRSRIVAGDLTELSDKELAAAPAIFADDPDVLVVARLAEVRAEADRRRREADERAAAKAAGPTAPARLRNPVGALGAAERMLENYGRDQQYARDGQARLLSARALTVGLPADATEAEVKKAERADERSHYERAGWTIAWYRHLGQFAEMTDRERQLDWLTGPADDPDAPEVVMPLPAAKVPKPVEAWEAMKQQAIYDRRAGINTGAERYTMALARSYGIPFDPADRSEEALRKIGGEAQDAMRGDPRTAAQQAASFIAEWRRLAAEDGVDPDNHLLYGPPDKRPKSVPRTQWTPTADEMIRVDRLVAGGMEYDDAYGEVMGIDPDEMRRAQAAMAVTGVMRPSDKMIRDHYAEFVYRQSLDAEEATNGYLLNKAGKAANIDPDSLFSGDPDRAYRYASEELLRFWGTPGNERKTYSEYKAELVGDIGVARRKRAAGSKGNQFA
jgi:hypothetical protein